MEKIARWCIKHKVDIEVVMLILAGLLAILVCIFGYLTELASEKNYAAIYSVLAVSLLGMLVAAFLVDVNECVHKLKRGEKP